MPPGKGRYTVGKKGSYGCSGYPVVGAEGTVHGCHKTKAAARAQQAAIYTSQNQAEKALEVLELIKVESDGFEKSRTVVANHPDCSGNCAVVDSDGDVRGCYRSKDEADAAAASENDDDMDDDDDDFEMSKGFWGGKFIK